MASNAELSSITSTLEELAQRVTAAAEQANAAGNEETASELFGVERSMAGALRRLRRLVD